MRSPLPLGHVTRWLPLNGPSAILLLIGCKVFQVSVDLSIGKDASAVRIWGRRKSERRQAIAGYRHVRAEKVSSKQFLCQFTEQVVRGRLAVEALKQTKCGQDCVGVPILGRGQPSHAGFNGFW